MSSVSWRENAGALTHNELSSLVYHSESGHSWVRCLSAAPVGGKLAPFHVKARLCLCITSITRLHSSMGKLVVDKPIEFFLNELFLGAENFIVAC